jgi:O-antigen ligase
MQHPWLGFGFGSFWHGTQGPSLVILNAVRWNVAQSHNGFLDLVLDIGFVGLAVFLVGYGIACYRACQLLRNHASMGFLWPLVFLVFLLVYNFTESGLLFQNSLFLALYAAVYAQSSVQEHFSETTETLDDGRTADGTMPLLALDIEPGL